MALKQHLRSGLTSGGLLRIYLIVVIGVLSINRVSGQIRWFKMTPGFTACQSFLVADTIVTFGIGDHDNVDYFTPVSYIDKNGNLIRSDTLDYFKLNGDTTSTNYVIYNHTIVQFQDSMLFNVGMNVTEKVTNSYKYRAHIFQYPQFQKIGPDINIDTFQTLLQQYSRFGDKDYALVEWNKPLSQLNVLGSYYLYQIQGNSKKLIYKVVNTTICASCHNPLLASFIRDAKNPEYLYLQFTDQWDFQGGPGNWQDYIIKIDTTGKVIWTCKAGRNDSTNTTGFHFIQKADGNIICAWTDLYYAPHMYPDFDSYLPQNNRNCTVWFAEIDKDSGKVLWRKNFRQFIEWKQIPDKLREQDIILTDVQQHGGKVSFLGYRRLVFSTQPKWKYAPVLITLDNSMEPLWYREHDIFPGDSGDHGLQAYTFRVTPDHSFLITGEYQNDGGLATNGQWVQCGGVLKLDSFGCFVDDCESTDGSKDVTRNSIQLKLYPNPSNGTFNIQLGPFGSAELSILSSAGSLVRTYHRVDFNLPLNCSYLAPGIYTVKIIDDTGQVFFEKLIISE